MTANNMNDMPSFAPVDTSVVDNTMYSQTVPIQMNNLDAKIADSVSVFSFNLIPDVNTR